MKYIDGLAIGAATILAVLYSVFRNADFPKCIAIGVCVGAAIDFAIKQITKIRKAA